MACREWVGASNLAPAEKRGASVVDGSVGPPPQSLPPSLTSANDPPYDTRKHTPSPAASLESEREGGGMKKEGEVRGGR